MILYSSSIIFAQRISTVIISILFFSSWKCEIKCCALVDLSFSPHLLPPCLLNNALDNGKPNAGSFKLIARPARRSAAMAARCALAARTPAGFTLTNHFHWYSPGLDLNDVGYLRQADVKANQVFVGWSEPRPKGAFREYSVRLAREDHWDFGGLHTEGSTQVEGSAQFSNMWRISGSVGYGGSVDTRVLRGGPALRESDKYGVEASASTDASRRTSVTLSASSEQATTGGTRERHLRAQLRLRPSNRLYLSANAGYETAVNDLQFVATVATAGGPRWVLGRIDQRVWDLTFRANLGITPELTVQYYGSPFIATGRYTGFKKATRTLAPAYGDRFHRYGDSEIAYLPNANRYAVTEAGGQGAAYSFANPDFSFQEFRSNLVVRWEYKPGSSLYVVWSQGRTGGGWQRGDTVRGNWDDLWRTRPDNVLLVKLSYWFSL